jgi:hypothetical protein
MSNFACPLKFAMPVITGEFDVKIEAMSAVAAETGFGRMSLDKQYHGALEATGKGEMLAYNRALMSGAYLAKRVEGRLAGLSGTLNIRIEGGKHYYDFDYTLAAVA